MLMLLTILFMTVLLRAASDEKDRRLQRADDEKRRAVSDKAEEVDVAVQRYRQEQEQLRDELRDAKATVRFFLRLRGQCLVCISTMHVVFVFVFSRTDFPITTRPLAMPQNRLRLYARRTQSLPPPVMSWLTREGRAMRPKLRLLLKLRKQEQ